MENIKEEKENLKDFQNKNNLFSKNLLLCNKCLSIPKVDINPYNHKIISICPNNHEINPISLDLYLKEELNKKILCSLCNKINELDNLLYCKNCLSIICDKCSNKHISNHQVIKYADINILCINHHIKNNFICLTCNKEICEKCLESREHINHKTHNKNEYLNLLEKKISNNLKNELITKVQKEKKQIELIKDMLMKKINNYTEIKYIENKINQRILNNYEAYPNNFNSIYNINNILNNYDISEKNYYEIISYIITLLENYFTNGNEGKEKLILIKRQNLKNIFFLILFLIIIIFANYFFGDFSTNKKSNEKNNNIIINENSNLLKLSEIFINEEQEKQINNYIIKNALIFIEQYNNIFNDNENLKYNISLNYKLIYKGTRDGDNIDSYHKRCDNKNNLLFLIETQNNTKFGIFSFKGYKDAEKKYKFITDMNMFVFKFNKENNIIHFYKIINKDIFLFSEKPSLFEIKQKEKTILYIPNNFLNENNYGWGDIKSNSFNESEEFLIENEFKKFLLKDIEVFKVNFKNNKT